MEKVRIFFGESRYTLSYKHTGSGFCMEGVCPECMSPSVSALHTIEVCSIEGKDGPIDLLGKLGESITHFITSNYLSVSTCDSLECQRKQAEKQAQKWKVVAD